MTESSKLDTNLSSQHDPIQANCLHSTGTVVEFKKEEIEQSISQRFEKIVRIHPHRIAMKQDNQAVTYAEFNVMANRLARAMLEKCGSGAKPVGLLVGKSTALFASMVGVSKAGKFFVLLDPSFPKARIAAVLGDSQAELVVTDQQNASLVKDAASNDCQLMEIESIDSAISGEDLKLSIGPEALAAVLYTSGSTGEPKGIVVQQRDFLHRIMLRTKENHVSDQDRIAVLSSSTGNAITNGFLALLNGATLLPFDVRKYGVARLGSWLRDERIAICAISSSLFRKLCETLTGLEEFRDLRVIRLRSEAVYRTDFDLYKKHFPPSCAFVTGISSSEAGQLTTYWVDHKSKIAGAEVPVGYPVEDKQVLLLDDDGREVGFNEVGEIVVRSRLLSPGYWRRPELTEAKFKADPLGGDKRLYFSGDLGLMLSDGCLVYKGRKDFRLKIRGYGVELGEIEKRLLSHPAIREAVVVAQRNDLREDHLVAYFTSHSQLPPSISELRSFLTEKLPDYMIPAAFVALEAMPLAPSGKVDRHALPMPDHRRPDLDTPYAAPRTPVEKELTKIWGGVLSLNQVGIHDNFFNLGGHSLLATQVITRIHETFHVGLAPSRFFEAPTVAALADYIGQVSLPQQGADVTSIERASRDKQLPLAFTQKRLWYLDQLAPGSSASNMVSAYRLTGRLDVTALAKSFNEIIRRHEILRTIFKDVDGEPYQVVLPSLTITIPLVDLRGIDSDAARESEVRGCFNAEAQRSFDLASGPLVRSVLLQLREDEYVFILAKHHIVYDGWCRGIIARELSTLYEAFSAGNLSPLGELPIQYADFAEWQRKYLQGELLEKQLAYWKKQLENVPALLLPTDRPRPPFQTSHGGRYYFALSKTVSRGLKGLANHHGATLFMTLVAAYMTLLHRYTGQNDIAIGSPIAGRNRTELEGLMGLFLNMLVLRVDLAGNPTFLDLLGRLREVCLAAYAHQELPFEKLVEELHPERSLSHNPLFQVTFCLQNTQKLPLELPGVKVSDLNLDPGTTRFDLELFVEDEENALSGYANYNADLFEAETIKRIVGHFQVLLEGIVANPEQRLLDLPLLMPVERHQLLVEWNDTDRDYPSECIHQLFEKQVERTPDAIAVVFEDERVTYRELNQRSNQLAHRLRKLGVGPEILVGICMEKSLKMVVAVLGVLKAGGAYVPLDPSYPTARLAFMLEDARVSVLLTETRMAESLSRHVARVICSDSDWELINTGDEVLIPESVQPDNLAYVIYTSGSTGKPKGVQVSHRAVVNFLNSMQVRPGLTEHDILLAVTTLSFDIACLELFLPLFVGARVVLVDSRVAADGTQLARLLISSEATVMQATPATWRLLREAGWETTDQFKVLCGGESLPPDLADHLLGKTSSVWNMYGPTETTIWSCIHLVDSAKGAIPIGRPIDNTQIYILDPYLNLVPVGVHGELYIGGVGLARGYRNHPEAAAEKFVPDPFSSESGPRLFRTGDRARYLPDGTIEFLGRMDYQTKIRGFRIELGEVETFTTQHPGVSQAIVIDKEISGDQRLIAYVVPKGKQEPSASDLREFLQKKLPQYMVPSGFVLLKSLPLTANGKVDRRALPYPDQERPKLKEPFEAPRNAVQETLTRIWAEVLKLKGIGIHDNFFDLGGHSLLATQLVSRIRKAFEIDLPLRTLFEKSTVVSLSEEIETIRWAEKENRRISSGGLGETEEITL